MMKIKTLILVVLMVIILAGCSTIETAPIMPKEDFIGNKENSLILKYVPNPREADLVFKTSNYLAMKEGVYTPTEFEEFARTITSLMDSGVSYVDLYEFVAQHVKWVNEHAGVPIIIVSEYFDFSKLSNDVISEYDSYLINQHLKEQIRIARMTR